MVRVVLTAINRTPKLLNCTQESLWQSVLDCAALGLFPDPLGRAYLVPYKDRCQLIVEDIVAWIDLAYRSGMVESIQARCVYAGDTWSYEYGLKPSLVHKPSGKSGDLIAVYSVIHLKGSERATFDVMSLDDVNRIRSRSRASDNGPWQNRLRRDGQKDGPASPYEDAAHGHRGTLQGPRDARRRDRRPGCDRRCRCGCSHSPAPERRVRLRRSRRKAELLQVLTRSSRPHSPRPPPTALRGK